MQRRLDELHSQIHMELAGKTLPDPAEVLRQAREERDKQILGNLLWHLWKWNESKVLSKLAIRQKHNFP